MLSFDYFIITCSLLVVDDGSLQSLTWFMLFLGVLIHICVVVFIFLQKNSYFSEKEVLHVSVPTALHCMTRNV